MSSGTQGGYKGCSYHPYLSTVYFKLTLANGAVPSVVSDKANLLAATPVTRSGEGDWVLNLKNDYKDIVVMGLHVEAPADGDKVCLGGTSVTAGANSVSFTTELANGTLDDLDGGVVHITLGLNLSDKVNEKSRRKAISSFRREKVKEDVEVKFVSNEGPC